MAFFSEQLIDVKNILWYHPVFPIIYDSAWQTKDGISKGTQIAHEHKSHRKLADPIALSFD